MDCVDPEVQPISQLHRYTIDLQTSVTSEQLLCERAMEFPAVSPDYTGAAILPLLLICTFIPDSKKLWTTELLWQSSHNLAATLLDMIGLAIQRLFTFHDLPDVVCNHTLIASFARVPSDRP